VTQTMDQSPLFVPLQLTAEQRELIRQRTGITIATLPFAADVPLVKCRFGGITLRVNRGVFTPSAATERLFELVREAVTGRRRPIIVDVGTGCGAVALALAAALPHASLFATEISDIALACARRNRDRLGLRNVSVRGGSLLSPLPRRLLGKVSAIAANIPYVPPGLSDAVRHAFPEGTAIGKGSDGLDLVRELVRDAREFLVAGGSLGLQLAGFQWAPFAVELRDLGYDVPTWREPLPNAPVVGIIRWAGGDA
jgi:release factor glutamine methyltransferase